MSLKARLGNAVQKRIEAIPSVEAAMARSERLGPIEGAAWRTACGTLDDEAARATLSEQLNADPATIREATIELSRRRDDYLSDRAYRLLSAAAAGSPVQPIPPERAELFAAEENLGRMPMEDAFGRLAIAEPRLAGIRRRVADQNAGTDGRGCGRLSADVKEELGELVGGAASGEDELLNTSLASSIVHQYLEMLAGDSDSGPPDIPYFSHPRKTFVASGRLWGRRPADKASSTA